MRAGAFSVGLTEQDRATCLALKARRSWSWRSLLPLLVAASATILAFGGLYYLEHMR
jgi:hypothetical protein